MRFSPLLGVSQERRVEATEGSHSLESHQRVLATSETPSGLLNQRGAAFALVDWRPLFRDGHPRFEVLPKTLQVNQNDCS
jgi:hypothetical protein